MRRIISLRALLTLLALAGGAKLFFPSFEGPLDKSGNRVLDMFGLVNPVFAAKIDTEKQAVVVPQACQMPEEIFRAIDGERNLLTKQKDSLEERMASVSLAEEKLKQETMRLRVLKKDLEDLFARVQQAKSDDLRRLVKIYRGMKPKEAATIMNTLDIEVAVMVLGQMKERDAAPIFAKLNLARSQAVSKIILERSKLPGDQDLTGMVLE